MLVHQNSDKTGIKQQQSHLDNNVINDDKARIFCLLQICCYPHLTCSGVLAPLVLFNNNKHFTKIIRLSYPDEDKRMNGFMDGWMDGKIRSK